jgi:hypothetical protein
LPAAAGLRESKRVTWMKASEMEQRPTVLDVSPRFQPRNPQSLDPVPPGQSAGMQWPGLRALRVFHLMAISSPRASGAPAIQTQQQPSYVRRDQLQPAGLPGPRAARIFALGAHPSDQQSGVRTANVPFKPAESPFGYGTEESDQQ